MERLLFPSVVAEGKQEIKVWSVGCSSGEEIYSFKILWEEWAGNRDGVPDLELWATDINPELIDRARTGVYSSSSLKEVHEEWRSKYFSPVKANRWAISDFLKEGIHWKVHNLLIHEPPSTGFQIIFLRNNLLTYYKVETLRPALAKLIETLSPSGFLMIGVQENLPREFTELAPFPHHPNIFQKIPFIPSPR
jgi:chemotaxis methyl-accepting protein methylase